ncbi:MAG TPA: phage tail protein [Gaiellaceae bacterium]|nr:phage tail protein [Gaiellaceae bacterium]
MDVNGTRFKLLLDQPDWSAATDEQGQLLGRVWAGGVPGPDPTLAWDKERHELTLRKQVFEFPAGLLDRPPQLLDRRGAGADVYGNWYWIGPDARTILVESVGDGSTTQFWPGRGDCAPPAERLGTFRPAEPAPPRPASQYVGAAVTEDHFLVVGTLDPPGLIVFDLLGGGPPSQLPWPAAVDFRPFDIARRPGGGVFVLDAEHGIVWELDRTFRIVPAEQPGPSSPPGGSFEPVEGPAESPPPRVSTVDATAVGADAIAVEAGFDGFLVLERGASAGRSSVAYYAAGSQVGAAMPVKDTAIGDVVGHDLALVGDTLFVADSAGNQAFAFTLELDGTGPHLTLATSYYPMRLFGGKGLVAANGQPWYDFGEGWIPLVAQRRSRYVESGALVTPVFDGAEPGCVWHRLALDAILPPDTSLSVSSKASDEADALAIAAWNPEPAPLARRTGVEVPFVDLGPYKTYELLFQRAQGRYLQVKLELRGDGRSSPRVRALRAWFPRFSYLEHYLPGVYREDPVSTSFLDRYLANIEGMSTAIEDRIAAAQVLLHPQTVPPEWLDWLASWFDLALDPMWDDSRRRLFLANAMRFFAARGTMRGVEIALRFALDACVDAGVYDDTRPPALATARIVESFRTRKTPGVVFGDPTDLEPLRVVSTTARWQPAQGAEVLDAGYAAYLDSVGLPARSYPIADPGDETSDAWRTFSLAAVGFVPQLAEAEPWQAFLSRRYPNAVAAATAHGLPISPAGFDELEPPVTLPTGAAAVLDWYQFESVVLPMKRKAHRFTVLLPWPMRIADSSGHQLDHVQLRDLAKRIADVQKPAHTTYDVKFFWAAFRVGEARLGDDTLLASGSRVPELVEPAVLGRDYVGTTTLAGPLADDEIRRIAPSQPDTQEAP